jgi:hypothetical protein
MSDFLATLHDLGVILSVESGRLKVDAPRGALTPELRQEIAARKEALLGLLRRLPEDAGAPEDAPPDFACIYRHPALWRRPDGGWACGVCHPDPRAPRDRANAV